MKTLLLLITLLSLNYVYAQEVASTDFVNSVIAPSVVFFVLIFGLLSMIKLSRYNAAILSLIITGGLFISGFMKTFSSLILSLGSLVSTFVFIALFLLGAGLVSRTSGGRTKQSGKSYYAVRKMSRKQLAEELSNIEKKLVDVHNKINRLKVQEHNLELRFSNEKTPEIVKELNKVRKLKNELADVMDMLLERKEIYKRAYRESTV